MVDLQTDFSEVYNVVQVQFSLLSPDEIVQNSVVPVTNTDINEGSSAETPKCNGVNDPRMGPSTPSSQSQIICPTDEQTFDNCPGYFGHIPLSKPVFWPQYISGAGGGGIVKTVLKFICYKCSKLLIDLEKPTEKQNFENSQRRRGRARYDSFKNLNPKKNCGSCQAPQPKYCVEQNTKLVAEFRQENDKAPRRVQFPAEFVRGIFSRMTDETISAMGFDPKLSRPEWLICSVFPNPPPAIRPSSLRIDTSQRAEDDLTVKLLEIVKYNKELAKKLKSEVRADQIDAYIQLLQVHIASYVNNDVNNGYKVMRKSGAAFKSLVTRFKGKTGRIRGNLMGKRANFSARSVITGDPSISVGEVGVPYKIAMVLTYPDIVTPLNKDMLTALVRNGPNKYPGARSIRRRGRPIHILQKLLPLDQLNQLDTIELEFGDIVNRHLMDGDFVLFNRQPSLHRMSMMSHRVRVLNGHTFRLQLAVVNPYNADFDGDEMNLSVPQNIESVMELENLCRVPLQIISPQHNAPVMGINQDALVGAFLLTNDDVRLTRRQMMQIQMQNSNFDGRLPKPQGKNGLYTGKQALSLILQDFSINYGGKIPIVIKDGELISGQLGKKQLGEVTNSITHVVFNDYGPDEALRFLDNEQQVVNNFLLFNNGFSVGMSDCLLPMNVRHEIRETIVKKLGEAAKFLTDAHENHLTRKSWYSSQQTDFEDQITDLLKKIREDTKGDQKITDPSNRFLAMMASGSKGKPENLIQIMSCLGQQVVSVKQAESSTFKSQRIPYNVGKTKGGFDGRTLPHFHRHDDGAAARGFCENSFLTGLNPHEFFFHNASGREGLIDTAIKSVTGNTPIVILENNITKRVHIGPWIDNLLDINQEAVEHHDEREMELLKIAAGTYIPTTDETGNVTWGSVNAVTRHDPGKELYKIETAGGRSVTVVESKSLIVWNLDNKKFEERRTPEIQIGDHLPVTALLPEPPTIAQSVVISDYTKSLSDLRFEDFTLDHDFGLFIGLYLISGITDLSPRGRTLISTSHVLQTSFLTDYLDHQDIQYELYTADAGQDGSHILTIFSTTLAEFLKNFVGSDKDTFVPDVAFGGPKLFLRGLLTAMNAWDTSSSRVMPILRSQRLMEGIAMIRARMGIPAMGKTAQINDVSLDRIITITKTLSTGEKVYDLTVPSTFNFGLANGLHVRDTADTGYLQRRLVKLMEDEKVYYDGTVRTNSRLIIQYAYGCDGIEPTKLERDDACKELYSADDDFLRRNCKMSINDDWTLIVEAKIRTAIKKDKELEGLLEDEFLEIYEGRRLLRDEIFKHPVSPMSLAAKTENAVSTQMPINLTRWIVNAKDRFKLRKKLSDLNPRYVVEQVSDLLEGLLQLSEGATNYQRSTAIDGMLLPRILIRYHLACKRVLTEYRFTKDMFDYVILQIKHRYFISKAQAGDMVGIIAAQSLGQPTTQMVLNSVEYDTELLLKVDGRLQRVKIGEYVDDKLEKLSEEKIEKHPHDTLLGWTKDKDIEILSCDEDGQIDWQKVEAVTRHPVINEDGSNTLLRVTLHSGRQVVATKGKSFLTRQDNKIKPSLGKDLKIGDYLPVSKVLPIPYRIEHLDLRDYLPPDKWLYMSEVEKALEWKRNQKKHWWKGHRNMSTGTRYAGQGIGTVFHLPYKRSDTFVEAFVGSPTLERPHRLHACRSGCVYPAIASKQAAHIPEKLALDEEFGFLCGAYLAEGNCTAHHMMISNLDDDFNERIDRCFKRWNVNYHVIDEARPKGWTKSLRSHSLVLTKLFMKLFGTGSHLKRIAPELFAAPDAFLKGLIGGYFDGDGCLTGKNLISAYSVSHGMLEDIQQILVRFGIKSSVRQMSIEAYEKALRRQPKARRGWTLTINSAETTIFQRSFEMTIRTKKRDLAAFDSKLEYGVLDIIPDIVTTEYGKRNFKRSELRLLIEDTGDDHDSRVLQAVINEDIIYDRVMTIEEVENKRDWVYDLTIANTKTFQTAYGLAVFDTFHHSGISQEFNVVDGVPRLEELISASKKPKAPTVTIYLKDQFANDEGRAQMVLNKLRSTAMKDIAKSSEIVYDPNDSHSMIQEDTEFLRSYYSFMQEEDCEFDSPWVLRLELDREKMLERQIRMWEIEQKLLERFEDELHCVLADDNAKNLIARVRVRNDVEDQSSDQDTIFLLKQVERHIMEETFRGIEGVQSAMLPPRDSRPFVQRISDAGAVVTNEQDREIVIIAQQIPGSPGDSLLDIFKLPEVDTYRTTSNFVGDVYKYLGVEAARNVLLREILKVYSSDYINHRHIEMLVDTMTCKGDLIAITRTGIVKLGVGPLARSSFEETETQFINAAVFAEVDACKGVSANCMVGQPVPGGTGECKILLDESLLPDLAPVMEETEIESAEEEQSNIKTPMTFDIGRMDDFQLEDDVETPFDLE